MTPKEIRAKINIVSESMKTNYGVEVELDQAMGWKSFTFKLPDCVVRRTEGVKSWATALSILYAYYYGLQDGVKVRDQAQEQIVKVEAKGYVLGHLWGGGKGTYPAREVVALTIEEVTKQIDEMFAKGSLDSGAGFESLIGARMILTIKYKRDSLPGYSKTEDQTYEVGDLTSLNFN